MYQDWMEKIPVIGDIEIKGGKAMTDEEIQNVLDELQNVRPEVLNGDAKRLFEAIMKIADERDLAWKVQYAMAEMLVKDHDWFYSEFDNYTAEDFIEYFEKKVEKGNNNG